MPRGCNCEKCQKVREYRKKYAERNKERLQAYQREYYQKNREKLLKKNNDWNNEHREEIRSKYKPHPRKLKPGEEAEKLRARNRKRYLLYKEGELAKQALAELILSEEAISEEEFNAWRERWRKYWSQKLKKATISGEGDTAPNSRNDAGAMQSERPDRNAAAST